MVKWISVFAWWKNCVFSRWNMTFYDFSEMRPKALCCKKRLKMQLSSSARVARKIICKNCVIPNICHFLVINLFRNLCKVSFNFSFSLSHSLTLSLFRSLCLSYGVVLRAHFKKCKLTLDLIKCSKMCLYAIEFNSRWWDVQVGNLQCSFFSEKNHGCQELDAKMTRKIVASHGNWFRWCFFCLFITDICECCWLQLTVFEWI